MPKIPLFLAILILAVTCFAQEQASGIEQVRQLITQGKYSDAEKLAKDLGSKSPEDTEVKFQLGRAIFLQDRFKEAIPFFEQVALALPKFAGAQKYLGDSYFALGDYKRASDYFLKAVEIEPKDAEYHLDLARSLAKLKSGQAEAAFRQALALDPNLIPALYDYGLYLAAENRLDAAEAQLSKALTLDDKSPYGWSVMGDLLLRRKSYTRAEDAYYRSLELDATRFRAMDGLSRLYMAQELWKDAEVITKRMIDADPTNLPTFLRMANIIDEQKRYADSAVIYEKLIKDHPKFATANVDYGVSLWRQDKNKEAEVQFKAGIASDPNQAWFHFTYGNFLRQAKRLREAKSAFQEALRLDPDYQEAKNRLDMVNLELG